MDSELVRAAQEALFCERVLAKTGDSVLHETLRGAERIETWAHYPKGDVFDPETGAQWYYHCHAAETPSGEHGHFHCFIRPQGNTGPVHHLIAVGVDPHGRLLRLFTVNQWVVGDDWLDAPSTIALLPCFDVHLAKPSYLVNRWLTAVLKLYETEIAALIHERDQVIASHTASAGTSPKDDRQLEVTSELAVNLQERAQELDLI